MEKELMGRFSQIVNIFKEVNGFRSTPGYIGEAERDAAGQETGRITNVHRTWDPRKGAKIGRWAKFRAK